MSRFRKQLLFLCDALLFAVAVAGYKFITVVLPYTEVGAKGSFPKKCAAAVWVHRYRPASV